MLYILISPVCSGTPQTLAAQTAVLDLVLYPQCFEKDISSAKEFFLGSKIYFNLSIMSVQDRLKQNI